jgi:serine/threonine protein kinase
MAGDDFSSGNYSAFLPPGTILNSTYEIIRLIGEGGMGVVFEAHHLSFRHSVAVKVIREEVVKHEEARRRFVEEGRIQAKFRHKNLVEVYDVVDEGSLLAIIMEYVPGSTLDDFVYRYNRPVDQRQGVEIILGVLDGLDYAHKRGVIHRDMKPGNVYLLQEGTKLLAKVSDFGVARDVTQLSLTVTGTVVGTANYMAPEQIDRPKEVDARTDLYALGVTLYEVMTKRLPFHGDSLWQVMKAHMETEVPSPSKHRKDLSPRLEAVILKALEKDPDDRFSNCEEMAAALREVIGLRKDSRLEKRVFTETQEALGGLPRPAKPPVRSTNPRHGVEKRPPTPPAPSWTDEVPEEPAEEPVEKKAPPDAIDAAAREQEDNIRRMRARLKEAACGGRPTLDRPSLSRPRRRRTTIPPNGEPSRMLRIDLDRWTRICLLLAIPIIIYQMFPFGHCLWEATDAYRLGSTGDPSFQPYSYVWIDSDMASQAAQSEGVLGALSAGAGYCLSHAGFGAGHPSMINLLLWLLLISFVVMKAIHRIGSASYGSGRDP